MRNLELRPVRADGVEKNGKYFQAIIKSKIFFITTFAPRTGWVPTQHFQQAGRKKRPRGPRCPFFINERFTFLKINDVLLNEVDVDGESLQMKLGTHPWKAFRAYDL